MTMDLRRSPAQQQAEADAEAFFDAHLTDVMVATAWENGTLHDAGLHRAIARQGWIGAWWPVESGGLGLSALQAGAIAEVAYRRNAPIVAQVLTEFAGYAILVHGTPEQRAEFLPGILSGDLLIALGFSEPDAGSDVAAVTTRAEPVDGGYVIDGAKIFTTMAHASDYVFLLARTDPGAPKHRGLSMFLVPLDAEGVEIHPVETFGGERTNATFYDNVFVPETGRVGAENEGWTVLGAALTVERAAVGSYVGEARRTFSELVAALTEHRPADLRDPRVRARLAEWSARIEAAAVLADRVSWLLDRGGEPTVEAAMTKLAVTDVFKDLAHEALDLAGPEALTEGGLTHAFRHSQVATIYGGSNEIQRNLIAQRALGLPRSY
jgi:alkylation response protein AidB-like acyl-CoA dehydrogenase